TPAHAPQGCSYADGAGAAPRRSSRVRLRVLARRSSGRARRALALTGRLLTVARLARKVRRALRKRGLHAGGRGVSLLASGLAEASR
ncbi:MAG: hypothetical protein Q4C41_09780, partial [Eggerthellaceae bacterium]|nr:hypothetical protein [Eggerthellaceae bacterium]